MDRQELEYERSFPGRAEVKNEWSYTPTPEYAFMTCAGTTLYLGGREEGGGDGT